MPGWLRKFGDRFVQQFPPVEPPAAARIPVDVQARIDELNRLIWLAYADGDMDRADRLIDVRLQLRPASPRPVPVVPGRVDSIINNYWENPR